MNKLIASVLLLALILQSVYSTEFLFNALKEHVPKIRCKLHKIGSKVIPHMHKHGDPCEREGASDERYEPTTSKPKLPSLSPLNEPDVDENATNNFVQTITDKRNNIGGVENNHIENQVPTGSYPTSMDIDIRFNVDEKPTTARSAKSYATVPNDGGRHIVKAPCKNGMIMTEDGCMEEI